ncbi:hypothetical protein Tco_0964902, partial [Tanacetum coccineum]
DTLLQPLFDEYFYPPPCVDHPVPEVADPVSVVSTGSPSSTSVDQDALSPSTSQTSQASPSHVIALSAEEVDHDIEVVHLKTLETQAHESIYSGRQIQEKKRFLAKVQEVRCTCYIVRRTFP